MKTWLILVSNKTLVFLYKYLISMTARCW